MIRGSVSRKTNELANKKDVMRRLHIQSSQEVRARLELFKPKKRKKKSRTHRGCHIWALPISMSGSSFLLSVCPKYVGNVAKTLREVGTYELRAAHRYRRRSARRGPARARFVTRAAGQISRSSWIMVCQDGVGKRSVL